MAIDKRRPKIPEFFPHGMAELIRHCWKDNPRQDHHLNQFYNTICYDFRSRPSASEACVILEHLMETEIERIEEARQAHFDVPINQLNGDLTNKRPKRNLTNLSLPSDQTDPKQELFNESVQID